MANKSILWIPRRDEEITSEYNVLTIHLAAHEPQNQTTAGPSDAETKKTNHWQIFLQCGPNNSIRLDPSPNYPKMDMTLSCSLKNYVCTSSAHKTVRLAPRKPITVGGFLELLKQNKYDKYNFTSYGTGCRYWTYCVVELLREWSVIDGLSANEAATAINTVWQEQQPLEAGNQTSLNDHQGKFVS